MLGNLARWLRILGYDVIYSPTMEDWAIMRLAEEERRVIATRDASLYRRAVRKGLEAVLIEDLDVAGMLRTLSRRLGIRTKFDENDTRCPSCNGVLRRVDSLVEVSGKVGERILKSYRVFWICGSCGKVYWKGRHWRTIEKTLAGL